MIPFFKKEISIIYVIARVFSRSYIYKKFIKKMYDNLHARAKGKYKKIESIEE